VLWTILEINVFIGNAELPTARKLPMPVTDEETTCCVALFEGREHVESVERRYPSSQVVQDFSEVQEEQCAGQSFLKLMGRRY